MRKQELVGLNWSDIGFDKGTVSVTKVLSYAPGIGNYLDDIRDGSERIITFSDKSIIPLLLEWKLKQSEERRGIVKVDGQQPIFNNKNNEHEASSTTARYFKVLNNNEDCKTVTAPGIRNTVCKMMFQDGADIMEVMRKCGYVDGRIPLRIYDKVIPVSVQLENAKLAVEKFEAYKEAIQA